MIVELVGKPEFENMMESHIKEILGFLLDTNTPFGLLTNIEYADFNPQLPTELSDKLQKITLFMIAGYTFESFKIDSDSLSFEAGFGPHNFGSIISMPILSVLQIVVEETPLLINLALPRKERTEKEESVGVKSSLEALLNNPENRRFVKKSDKRVKPDRQKGD